MTAREELAAERPDVTEPETWDRIWGVEPEYHDGFGRDLSLWRAVARHVGELPGPLVVADVAGGRGEFLEWLRSSGFVGLSWSTLFDFSPRALEEARLARRVEEFVLSDAAALDYDDDAFDVVFAIDLLQIVEDPVAVVLELGRVARSPGGRVVVSSATVEHWQQLRMFHARDLHDLVATVGIVEKVLRDDEHIAVVGKVGG